MSLKHQDKRASRLKNTGSACEESITKGLLWTGASESIQRIIDTEPPSEESREAGSRIRPHLRVQTAPLEYVGGCQKEKKVCLEKHTCGAPSQHRLFKWLWEHPSSPLKFASMELHLSYSMIKTTYHRLKRKPLFLYCPECFRPSVQELVCTNCGIELDMPSVLEGANFEETSPVHTIQPNGGLGSRTNYAKLRLQYGARNIEHLVERPRDPFLESAKSMLWEEVKRSMPKDEVVEEAARLLAKEVKDFEQRYPMLVSRKGVKEQLVKNVLHRMKLRYKVTGLHPSGLTDQI